jgi:GTPase SAR1 family protein
MTENTPLQIASEFVRHTSKNIFLTGKAGTGKTTFLHSLRNTLDKRMAIVAPTGVAAINAGGVTIHSFFQLPFGPHIPGTIASSSGIHKFTRERINLIKSLDLLVIDEISMVRADMLDAIDEVLRKYKNRNEAFGGVQLLMIGDLHQLSPVIKDEDWNLLKDYYNTVYFFGSRALQSTNPVRIELTHIYRQSDTHFIDLLNRIRENQIDRDTLEVLNQRLIPNFHPAEDDGYITLTTHNASAQQINAVRLNAILSKSRTFKAELQGDFPPYSFPTELELELKVGAQVMFVKNDGSRDKRFYNGKIGQVTSMTSDTVYVKCKDDDNEIVVAPAEWKNVKYVLNPVSKEIDEEILGSFRQFPLKLAWAITIHKSQGLTFEKAIIDANAAFAHGQVYVALSRCKSFEGMVLSSKISLSSVKTDGTVAAYSREAGNNPPDHNQLSEAKNTFHRSMLLELFDFSEIKSRVFQLNKIVQENASIINPAVMDTLTSIQNFAESSCYTVSDKFRNQLSRLTTNDSIDSEEMGIRVKKGCEYFLEKIDQFLYPETQALTIETDNAAIKKTGMQTLDNLQKAIFIKRACMRACQTEFNTAVYLRARANADIDFKPRTETAGTGKAAAVPKNIAHGKLYAALKSWRNGVASEHDVLDYMVLPMKTLLELTETRPTTLTQLASVKGIGKTKVKQYGKAIIQIIADYCDEAQIEKTEPVTSAKKTQFDTKQVSLALHKDGKTIEEIAKKRGFTPNTVETHLLSFIGSGALDIYAVYQQAHIDQIINFFSKNKEATVTEAKIALDETISYHEIRAVRMHLKLHDL